MSQLDLFEGVILTQEQEKKVENFIQSQQDRSERQLIENENIQNALIEAGFIENIDFKNTFEVKTFTHDVTLGYSYNDSQFTTNLTHVDTKGGITLLSKSYDPKLDKIIDRDVRYFSREGDKFECSSLTGNFRKIKASTMLTKLQEQRSKAERNMVSHRQTTLAFAKAIDTLKSKFPNANILRIDDYDSNGRSYRTVKRIKAQFENGSFITFNVSNDGSYRINKKYDAAIVGLDSDQLMEYFTNQNK